MLFLLLVLLVILLSIPAVQTKIAKKVTDNLNETYGTDISIGRLGLNWKGEVDLREVLIRDHHQDTLIYSQYLQTNIQSVQKLIAGNLDFGFLDLTNAKLYVTTYKDEYDDNLTVFTEKFNTGDTTSTEPFQLLTDQVTLNNTHVRVVDQNQEEPLAIELLDIYLDADDFSINGPIIATEINSLSFLESRGLKVEDLSADFTYTETQILLDNLYLATEYSKLEGNASLTFENGMSNFRDSVVIEANFENSKLSTNDLNKFYPEFGENLTIQLDGNLKGTLNDFNFNNANVQFAQSHFRGNFAFKNLFNEQEYLISGVQHDISTNYFDLRRLLPNVIGNDLPEELKSLETFTLRGSSEINGDVLQTNSSLSSALGGAKIDAVLGNITDFQNAYYRGTIKLEKFNLAKLSGTTSLGTIDGNLKVDGRGFSAETVKTQINGVINSIVFEDYNYTNINVSGNLENPLFNGKLSINDPNLKMDFNGLIDVSKEQNHYDFEANIEFAELNKLNLFKRDSVSVFAGTIKMDMDGTTINDAVGTINFSETFYQTAKKDFFFDDFTINSRFEGEERIITINSPDIVNGTIKGKFLIEDIPYLFRNSIGSIYTNYVPVQVTTDQYLTYELDVYNKIVDVFIPELQLGENTRIKGAVYSDESKFQLDFKSPELLLYKNYLGKVNVQLDNDNPLYNAYIAVDSIYTGTYNFTDVNLINKTLKDTLYVQTEFKGGKASKDKFNLSFYHTINPDGNSVVGIKKSKINYQGNDWFLNRSNNNLNKITFDDKIKKILKFKEKYKHE